MGTVDNTFLDKKRAQELAASEQVLLYIIENELGIPVSKDNSDMIPFHRIIYNNAQLILADRMGITEGIALDIPIIEFYREQSEKQVLLKGNALLAPDHIIAHPDWTLMQA